jgi:hypothetical protein
LGSVRQSWPHVPQLETSDFTSTHFAPQRSGDGAAQLDEQPTADAVVEQSAVGAAHALPHAPQLVAVVSAASQPSSARVEQCP